MQLTEGAFRNWGYELARNEFGGVTITEEKLYGEYRGKRPQGLKDRVADIMLQMLLLRPEEFDVLATLNLNGDYISDADADADAAKVGGMGIAALEATHGTIGVITGADISKTVDKFGWAAEAV